MPYILGNNNDVKGEDSFSSSNNDFGLDYGCGYAPALADIFKKDGFNIDVYDPFFFPNKNIFLVFIALRFLRNNLDCFWNFIKIPKNLFNWPFNFVLKNFFCN